MLYVISCYLMLWEIVVQPICLLIIWQQNTIKLNCYLQTIIIIMCKSSFTQLSIICYLLHLLKSTRLVVQSVVGFSIWLKQLSVKYLTASILFKYFMKTYEGRETTRINTIRKVQLIYKRCLIALSVIMCLCEGRKLSQHTYSTI